MEKEAISYCGLNCETCQQKFAVIRQKGRELNEAMDSVNFTEVAKVIPFMNRKYKSYLKFMKFFDYSCPGCREGGGNPFCGIRKCAAKKGYFTCAECDQLCKRFKPLYEVHTDNEIQNNIAAIRELGIDEFVKQ